MLCLASGSDTPVCAQDHLRSEHGYSDLGLEGDNAMGSAFNIGFIFIRARALEFVAAWRDACYAHPNGYRAAEAPTHPTLWRLCAKRLMRRMRTLQVGSGPFQADAHAQRRLRRLR